MSSRILHASSSPCGLRDDALGRFKEIISKDTTVFHLTNFKGTKVLNFSNNNTLTINSYGIKLIMKEELQDSYTLLVKRNNTLILSKKHIKGISKVLFDKDYLLFSLFTYEDEDGNNEGFGYIINLKTNAVNYFSKLLKNTCNPVIINKNIYFIDGLSLIKTDLDFKIKNKSKIIYLTQNKNEKFDYFDTYLISRLSKQDGTKLIIDLLPDKSSGRIKSYTGSLDNMSKVILLK